MWPFKKKEPKEETLVMIRYTEDASQHLFPNLNHENWETMNRPDDVALFVIDSIARTRFTSGAKINNALIATIDSEYLSWLSNNRQKHSPKALSQYLKLHVEDVPFWDKKLIDSGMTESYNILGIPCLAILHNYNGENTEYMLNNTTSSKILELLQNIYANKNVFVPGWFLKGNDMFACIEDIKHLADVYWSDGIRARLGKFLEQSYHKKELIDRFSPLYFVVPFVVKTKIETAFVNLRNPTYAANDNSVQAMSSIVFKDNERMQLFNLISNDIPNIISVGSNAVMANQAHLAYHGGIIKRSIRSKNTLLY